MKIDFDLRNADDVQWTRKRSLPRQQIEGIILINREIEKINLINRTGYHVSCILLPLLHIDGSSAPSMIKTVGQERNNEHPKFLKLPLYFNLVSIGAWMA